MCIIKSTPRTCGNCKAEDIALTEKEECEAVKEGKACPGEKKIVGNDAWLCPACHANTARGSCYRVPGDYQPKIRQEVAKKETGSFTDKVKKVFGKKQKTCFYASTEYTVKPTTNPKHRVRYLHRKTMKVWDRSKA